MEALRCEAEGLLCKAIYLAEKQSPEGGPAKKCGELQMLRLFKVFLQEKVQYPHLSTNSTALQCYNPVIGSKKVEP